MKLDGSELPSQVSAYLLYAHAAEDGLTVVSGLAYGIDSYAHRGSLLSAAGQTAAVLPSGIDTITPSAHTRLAARLLQKGGLILSEYVPGTPALSFRFVQRNRIIAALSYGRDVMLHAECFSPAAEQIENANLHDFRAKAALGKKIAHKLENSVRRYREDGAPVIASYAEYKQCRAAAPGTVFCKRDAAQDELF